MRVLNDIISTPSNVTSMSFQYEDSLTADDADKTPTLSGSRWAAVEVANIDQFVRPVTLEFDPAYPDMASGSSGCNRYRAQVESLSENTFSIGVAFSATRKYCVGAMEQERQYIQFLQGKTFAYEVVDEAAGGNDVALVLYDLVGDRDGVTTRGEVLARFSGKKLKNLSQSH